MSFVPVLCCVMDTSIGSLTRGQPAAVNAGLCPQVGVHVKPGRGIQRVTALGAVECRTAR